MRLVVKKEELDWAKEMQDEGRTRDITFSTFRRKKDDSEIEVEVVEIDRVDEIIKLKLDGFHATKFETEMRKTENRKINETEKEILKHLQ